MRALVTGGAGFIGAHVAAGLLDAGHDARLLDNLSSGSRSNITALCPEAELVEGDVRDADCVRAAVRGCEAVFHLAALVSVPASVEDPSSSHATNVGGSLNVLLAARDEDARLLVFASSSAVYGDAPETPKREAMAAAPSSPYGADKLAVEGYCQAFSAAYGIQTVALRYFNVFGPHQDPASHYAAVIPRFITTMLERRAPVIFGDGEQSRDFVAVADVVRANLRALAAPAAGGRVYNVASGRAISVNELHAQLRALLGSQLEAEHAEPRPGDVRHSFADISRIGEELGFEPSVGMDEGLEQTIAYYRARAAERPSVTG